MSSPLAGGTGGGSARGARSRSAHGRPLAAQAAATPSDGAPAVNDQARPDPGGSGDRGLGRGLRVEGAGSSPQPLQGEERPNEPQAGGKQERHPVAAPDPEQGEASGERLRVGPKRSVGEALPGGGEREPIRGARGTGREHLVERSEVVSQRSEEVHGQSRDRSRARLPRLPQ